MKKVFQTERFDVFYGHVERNPDLGSGRDLYVAFHRLRDIPRPLCEVTLWSQITNYVEWIHVDEKWRRKGVATEILRAIENEIGFIDLDGTTTAGKAFCEWYCREHQTPTEE